MPNVIFLDHFARAEASWVNPARPSGRARGIRVGMVLAFGFSAAFWAVLLTHVL